MNVVLVALTRISENLKLCGTIVVLCQFFPLPFLPYLYISTSKLNKTSLQILAHSGCLYSLPSSVGTQEQFHLHLKVSLTCPAIQTFPHSGRL